MKNAIAIVLAATAFASGTAFAEEKYDPAKQGPVLAEKKQCLTCHSVDKTMPDMPSFRDIAKRYKDRQAFEGMLITQILSGTPPSGTGYHWGVRKMPGSGARAEVSVYEANLLLDWILSLK